MRASRLLAWLHLRVGPAWPWSVLTLAVAFAYWRYMPTMSTNDSIRWTWTIATGLGVAFASWNLREVLIDNWALSESPQFGVEVLRLQTRSAVWDHALILAALASDFAAGACSLLGLATGALIALLASALLLILLSFSQTQRRRRLFDVLRLRRTNRKKDP